MRGGTTDGRQKPKEKTIPKGSMGESKRRNAGSGF
jgi:hypothetical protein